jgi:tRNA dimethylallyltransferase
MSKLYTSPARQRPIVFIVGPTAVGKTDVAVTLVKRLHGEIVSCDSMQVYKELNIVSAKPSERHLKAVPHHLIDILPLSKNFDVATFNRLATKAVRGILKRGKIPVVVGGSGLYMSILLDGIFKEETGDERVRNELEGCAKQEGVQSLYARLLAVDPLAAKKIHPHDARRIIRALEVFMVTKKPISQWQAQRAGLWGRYPISIFALTMRRDRLYERINDRVDRMFKKGAVEEIRRIAKRNLSLTARPLIGIKEILGFLNHEYDQDRAVDLLKRNTRHFAKRQLTWFRKDQRIRWIEINDTDTPANVAKRILKEMKSCSL